MPDIVDTLKRFLKRRIKDFFLGCYLPHAYRHASEQCVNPAKIVFLEAKEKGIPDSFETLYDRITTGYSYEVMFISLGQNRVSIKQYYRNCKQAVVEIATAGYVFLNDASDIVSCLPLRPETKIVQLWHACGAFKKWGMSTADLIFGGTRKDLLRHPFYRNLSLVTVSSPEVSWAYIEAMVLEDRPEIVQPLGVSRTDRFFEEGFLATARSRVEKLIPQSKSKEIILYAPTFRGRVSSAEGPDKLDIEALKNALGHRYILLIKHHPFVKRLPSIPDSCTDFAFQVSEMLPIDELLSVADVCISDYSSLVFEYSLFAKPMVFFAYDLEDYSDWRGFYYDYDELTPGPVFTEMGPMVDYLAHIDEQFDEKQIRAFREKFMSACDGHSTDRICAATFGEDEFEGRRIKNAHETLVGCNGGGIDISIVIPAHNAMPHLTQALKSVVDQAYDASRIECIVVDDGSSDSTWDEIQRFVREYSGLFKGIRLPKASGSPAEPRNIGLESAQGEYVFFLDADDWLGAAAVEKMLDHAVAWKSDVLLVKLVSEGGRDVPKSMFGSNQPDVDVYSSKVMWTFGPMKLFRRSLLVDNKLRFPSFMPEDISFVLRAYVLAKTVSVAADYDYYHYVLYSEDEQCSFSTWDDFESNMLALKDIFDFVEKRIPPEKRDATLMKRLFRRDVSNMLCSAGAWENSDEGARRQASIVSLVRPFYNDAVSATMPLWQRAVLEVGLSSEWGKLHELVAAGPEALSSMLYQSREDEIVCSLPEAYGSGSYRIEKSIDFSASVETVFRESDGAMRFAGALDETLSKLCGPCANVEFVAKTRIGNSEIVWPAKTWQESPRRLFECSIDAKTLKPLPRSVNQRWHLYIRVRWVDAHKDIRLSGGMLTEAAAKGFLSSTLNKGGVRFEPYTTEYGNISYRQAGAQS